nr:MAG TPA: glycoprotein [Caudoviricetes sp.]
MRHLSHYRELKFTLENGRFKSRIGVLLFILTHTLLSLCCVTCCTGCARVCLSSCHVRFSPICIF